MEYLKAVLRQEVGYFDNNAASSTSFQVVSTISSDAHIIQDTIVEKVFDCLRNTLFFLLFLCAIINIINMPFTADTQLPDSPYSVRL
jgi:ATP-binding cassette subfamily B (MDR/TAP) protein 1